MSSFQSAVTDDKKHFQCLNKVLNNKTGPLFFNSIHAKTSFGFFFLKKRSNLLKYFTKTAQIDESVIELEF